MEPTLDPIGGDTAPQAHSRLPSRRDVLGLCVLAFGLAACEGEARWDPETGKFRIPLGGSGGRSGNR